MTVQHTAAPAVAARRLPPSSAWQRRYAVAIAALDGTAIAAVTTAGILSGVGGAPSATGTPLLWGTVACLLAFAVLGIGRAWEPRVLGTGPEEYRRVARCFAGTAVVLGLLGLAMHELTLRPWVFGFLPLAGLTCAVARHALRYRLRHARRAGRCMRRVLAVGGDAGIADLVERTRRDPGFGWRVAAVCTPTGIGPGGSPELAGVPVVGDLDDVARAAQAHHVDVVAIVPTPGWGPPRLHRLAWDLEDSGIELAVTPGLAEIAGPRMHVTPVDGIPLLRLSKPRLGGGTVLLKDVIDRSVAAVALALLAPLLLVVALTVRRDGGPALHREVRLGVRGRPFHVLTFRTGDPATGRPTATGRALRRYALDGLPRLINVAGGTMGLIGPPAPLPFAGGAGEPETVLPIKPGLIGLPHVDPPDRMSREESVRGALRYVEHWSATRDLSIIWRTMRSAAGRRRG